MLRTASNDNRLNEENSLVENKKLAKRLKEIKPTINIEVPFQFKNNKKGSKKDNPKDDLRKYIL